MSDLSESTILMNCVIALASKTPDFPYPLWDAGFQIETIEPKILLSDGLEVRPDIQLKKNSHNYLLFFECKDGYCERDQLNRYKSLKVEDIIRSHKTELPDSDLKFDLTYFGTEDKKDKLLSSIPQDQNPFPIIILNKEKIYSASPNKFKIDGINDIFTEIEIDKPVPESFIPFTPNDGDRVILRHTLREIVSFAEPHEGKEFTLSDLLKKLCPEYALYSQESIDELKNRIGKLLTEIIRAYPDINDYLSKRGGETYRISDRAVSKGFRNLCEYIIGRTTPHKMGIDPNANRTQSSL